MKRIDHKVKLFRLESDGTEMPYSSGSLMPNPPEVGKSLWVGSITSRDGWTTTPLQSVKRIKGGLEFTTLNSTYRVRPIP